MHQQQNLLQQPNNNTISPLQLQLMQMGFQLNDIKQAISRVKSQQKQKIVQYLINCHNKTTNQDKNKQKNQQKMINQNNQNNSDYQQVQQSYKMLFLARMDLKLPLHKIATHVATSCLAAFKQIQSKIDYDTQSQLAYYQWTQSGQKKIVVKVNSEQELLDLVQKIKKQKINVYLNKVTKQDQLANVPEGTVTVAAVGPATEEVLDKMLGHLKLF